MHRIYSDMGVAMSQVSQICYLSTGNVFYVAASENMGTHHAASCTQLGQMVQHVSTAAVQAEQSWRFQESAPQPKVGRGAVDQDPSRTVRVKSVPFSASEEDVSAYFTRAGTVEHVEWPVIDGKRSSSLFVQFADAAAVAEACKLTGQLMMGREITVLPKAQEGQQRELNLGQAVKDCWFCLSNDQVCRRRCADVAAQCDIWHLCRLAAWWATGPTPCVFSMKI